MEFKTFLNAFLRLPCQIVRSGPAPGLSPAELESLATAVLPHVRPVALLSEMILKPESGCSGPPRQRKGQPARKRGDNQ